MSSSIPSGPPPARQSGIVSIHTRGGELETTNTDLAACLSALGIPLRKECPVRKLEGDRGRQLCFFFEEQSKDGRFQTAEMIAAFQDITFIEKFPEHPMAYLAAAYRNRARLLDYTKSNVPMMVIERGRKMAFVPANVDARVLAATERELR